MCRMTTMFLVGNKRIRISCKKPYFHHLRIPQSSSSTVTAPMTYQSSCRPDRCGVLSPALCHRALRARCRATSRRFSWRWRSENPWWCGAHHLRGVLVYFAGKNIWVTLHVFGLFFWEGGPFSSVDNRDEVRVIGGFLAKSLDLSGF